VTLTYPMLPGFEYGSDTSEEAAESVQSSVAGMRARALNLLRMSADGLTSDELERITGWLHQSASARLRELVLCGLAFDSADRRRTRSGRNATVRRPVLS
jgi:hypothetical protein